MSTVFLTFNTKNHTLRFFLEATGLEEIYDNVVTIQLSHPDRDYYEVLQETPDGKKVPLLRVPIQFTIIKYEHS
jgi:hypothetical protein